MARRGNYPDTNKYVIEWDNNGKKETREVIGARRAIEIYNFMKCVYGDTTRLLKVVLDYGAEI